GTAIGAAIGGALGAWGGGEIGGALGKEVFGTPEKENKPVSLLAAPPAPVPMPGPAIPTLGATAQVFEKERVPLRGGDGQLVLEENSGRSERPDARGYPSQTGVYAGVHTLWRRYAERLTAISSIPFVSTTTAI
ncbi:hypothetical protein ALQ01_102096, partial [Pseudomonas savastanoi pv. glycinea]